MIIVYQSSASQLDLFGTARTNTISAPASVFYTPGHIRLWSARWVQYNLISLSPYPIALRVLLSTSSVQKPERTRTFHRREMITNYSRLCSVNGLSLYVVGVIRVTPIFVCWYDEFCSLLASYGDLLTYRIPSLSLFFLQYKVFPQFLQLPLVWAQL